MYIAGLRRIASSPDRTSMLEASYCGVSLMPATPIRDEPPPVVSGRRSLVVCFERRAIAGVPEQVARVDAARPVHLDVVRRGGQAPHDGVVRCDFRDLRQALVERLRQEVALADQPVVTDRIDAAHL